MSSWPTPSPDCTVLKVNSWCIPTNQAPKPTSMNREILVKVTGTPTARALSLLPPTAKIQLPYFVRSSTQVASAAKISQYTTVIFTVTPPTWKVEAKIFFAWSKPSMVLMSSVATLVGRSEERRVGEEG